MSVFLLVSAVVLTSCLEDGEASSPTDPTTPTTTVAPTTTTTAFSAQAVGDFHDCLIEGGIEIEEIPSDAQGRPRLDLVMIGVDLADPDTAAIVSSCSELLSTGALDLTNSPLIGSGVVGLLSEFSECLRSHGVPDFPDPLPGFAGIGGPYPVAEIPYSDPDLGSAIDECRSRISTTGG
jgi:hypothetical protein